jgi:hypothetical protein
VKNAREKLAARFGDTQIGGKGKNYALCNFGPREALPNHNKMLTISLFRHSEKKEEAC